MNYGLKCERSELDRAVQALKNRTIKKLGLEGLLRVWSGPDAAAVGDMVRLDLIQDDKLQGDKLSLGGNTKLLIGRDVYSTALQWV